MCIWCLIFLLNFFVTICRSFLSVRIGSMDLSSESVSRRALPSECSFARAVTSPMGRRCRCSLFAIFVLDFSLRHLFFVVHFVSSMINTPIASQQIVLTERALGVTIVRDRGESRLRHKSFSTASLVSERPTKSRRILMSLIRPAIRREKGRPVSIILTIQWVIFIAKRGFGGRFIDKGSRRSVASLSLKSSWN